MNRRTSSTLIVAAVLLAAACSPSRETIDPPGTITGQVMVVGNEPFTRLALLVSPEKSYLIQCDGVTKKLLMSNQGQIVELVYNKVLETDRGEELNVLSATVKSK